MKTIEHTKASPVWLISLCAIAAFAFGSAGRASASTLLFVPHSGHFPYHLVGTFGVSKLEKINETSLDFVPADALAVILSHTLVDLHLRFLKFKIFGVNCSNTTDPETVLMNLLGHLGLADPDSKPALLLLVPAGFEFSCGLSPVKIRGTVIAMINKPAISVASELFEISLKQSKGIQEFTTFLQGSELLTRRFLEVLSTDVYEQAGWQGAADLKALPGEGTFLLVLG